MFYPLNIHINSSKTSYFFILLKNIFQVVIS